MEQSTGCSEYAECKRVLLAVDESPQSRGAVVWAARSLIRPEDEVLIFHAIKALEEVKTPAKAIPFHRALPNVKKSLRFDATEKATKMVNVHASFCEKHLITARTEVAWAERRKAILQKVEDFGATHLIMGSGRQGRRLGLFRKEGLSEGIVREAKCAVFLVDKAGHLVSRSSYNSDGKSGSKRHMSAAAARAIENALFESIPDLPSPGPPLSHTTSSDSSGNRDTESDHVAIPDSPLSTSSGGTPRGRTVTSTRGGLRRVASSNSPLSNLGGSPRSGGSPKRSQNGSPKSILAKQPSIETPPRLSSLSIPPRTERRDLIPESDGSFLFGLRRVTSLDDVPAAARIRRLALHVGGSAKERSVHPLTRADGRMASAEGGSRAGDVRATSADDGELERLRAQVAELELMSALRENVARQYAARLEVTRSEADAMTWKLADESRRRKAAERTASQLVTILGSTAPDKVVEVLNGTPPNGT
ncbi:hypothetical protein KFL_002000100 [Klebsormidium nitens]|uniref:UspA domain-containing protein n=1 Tax=Klebsormidium nitens TaxID=105231 RepID=A0A1Y1I188_KLENI|nr:hypothetical protein KFL_002000100 [Klebsormidium nitens]|eukprot:GAQ84674.1 hypothetical protein KFL_002000100 [Klebsormidium nitens]